MANSGAPSKGLHVGLWVVQVVLGLAFSMAGAMKLFTPIPELSVQMAWVNAFPELFVRFVGLSELAGGVGLVLPSALRIQPWLTPLAAAGLTLTMAAAVAVHVWLGEGAMSAPAVVFGSLAAFVAWGRSAAAPIEA